MTAYIAMGIWRISGLLCLVACARAPESSLPQAQSRGSAHYTVTIFDNFGGARAQACFEGAPVRELVPIDDNRAGDLRGAWIDGVSLRTVNGRISLGEPSRAPCVEYETRFGSTWFEFSDSSAVILSQAQWLWRPEPFPNEIEISMRFVLPVDAQVSLPWSQVGGIYFPDESAFFVDTYAVFGSFERQAFSVAGTSVDVARLGARPSDDDVHRWLSRAVQTAASVGAGFPRDHLHFVIVPVHSPRQEVAFGMLRRGGGSSILLLPSLDATAGRLETDWVAIHELSHLWLPRVYSEDRWLSEGIATYLQEVLRARCGLQSRERAWRRLQEGFERGRRSGGGRPLATESRDMNRTGAYHRVYWAGAAFALETDVRLRQDSNGEMTLLAAISRAHHVWGAWSRPVSAPVLLEALEQASGAGFIEELGGRYAARSEFPDVAYVHSPRYRAVRRQIMSQADGACEVNAEPSR